MIEIINLKKSYSKNEVLNISNLKIESNQCLGIMGQNGSGKTTLSEIIMGSKKQSSGEIKLEIENISKNAVFQECQFEPDLSLKSIVKFYKGLFKSKEDTDELFKRFDLENLKRKRFNRLSGGQKQKFKLLVAFINRPNLLLLDELTTSLDYVWREKIHKIIIDYVKNNPTTVLLVSHDVNEIAKICNRVILLDNGSIVNDLNLTDDFKKNLDILEKEVVYATDN
ncbi:ABC transporter ATP-binding protein [Spiroplasma helicoides]|uniref:ABC transporter ATP-binding protein n=1 Tax=Spiroplasma helicoides TaxID=216938 RepID=A0A1B3SKH4_9MOLU|nr:ABC transporter ATP-binding protein [Spiroplasma helicoides]AOG60438.1 ABC transporter ATP-binding protein [Spiroplasma helicoides]